MPFNAFENRSRKTRIALSQLFGPVTHSKGTTGRANQERTASNPSPRLRSKTMPVRTGEILFVKCVKCGIPNRDPLRDSDARRLFGEDDGRISLSDVSIKRDIRDYVVARFPEDGADRSRFVFVQKKYSSDGKTLL